MNLAFLIRAGIYVLCFLVCFWAMSALDYERFLKKGHVSQAQVLYWLCAMALAYLAGSFLLSLIYPLN